MASWNDTVNLPRTSFPMKANLPNTEQTTLAEWSATDLYGQIRARRAGKQKFVLHDGPPYANGRMHMGLAFNKILKDFVVRSHTMAGFDAPFVPGWDCHGLPIELGVDQILGARKKAISVADFRRECRVYADKHVALLSEEFVRLGLLGDWSNPYLTMDYAYQAAVVRALAKFVEQGLVYKGNRPGHWCIHCRTLLAEVEVEFEQYVSPSIFVEFPLSPNSHSDLATRVPTLAGQPLSVLIWTTTPWTIPANLALAFHPDLTYAAYAVDGTTIVVAKDLSATISTKIGRYFGKPVAEFEGKAMERLVFQHPLYDRASPGLLGEHVTLDGTGVVHIAPGHGTEDFYIGARNGLEIYSPVDAGGHFLESVELFKGLQVFEAEPTIEGALAARGRLWHSENLSQMYPHCWRCHNPAIVLVTSQWFISMQTGDLRERALKAIDETRWTPWWGQSRIAGIIANRPDWCISRQRVWGVPVPAVDCKRCGHPMLTREVAERAAAAFDRFGADAWYERPIEEFLPDAFICERCGGHEFEREGDVLDIWFEAGASHEIVLSENSSLRWPADLYLEDSGQHRGWFHSSLLTGIGIRGKAPYREVLSHGFVVDEGQRMMSKARGNLVTPQEIIATSGADVLRLWVSMADFTENVRIGPEVLSRTIEAYRKLRNVWRVLVANLYDFDPALDLVSLPKMEEVDRFILSRLGETTLTIRQAYMHHDFPTVFHSLSTLVSVDLSAFYVNVTKDRLYTLAASSPSRRSAQTAMYLVADSVVRLVAPILPFTAEEMWRHLPGVRPYSVHLEGFPTLDHFIERDLNERWTKLLRVRDTINASIEKLRKTKVIGSSLAAHVRLAARGDLGTLLNQHRRDLAMLFMVSELTLDVSSPEGEEELHVEIVKARGQKCERCWRIVPKVASTQGHAGLCPRCVAALGGERENAFH